MRLNLIAALDSQQAIGLQNGLPWRLPGELEFFKKITWGQCLVMGRKTFDSLQRRPLPGRLNIVLSRSASAGHGEKSRDASTHSEQPLFSSSIEEAEQLAASYNRYQEIFFIGGGDVYQQTIDRVKRMFLTHINHSFEGDCWFPPFDGKQWLESTKVDRSQQSPIGWKTVCYERRSDDDRLDSVHEPNTAVDQLL